MVTISSRAFSKGGGVQRRELSPRTGEQQRQAYYPTGGVLTVGNFAHSSRPATIICFASDTAPQDRTPARFDEHSQLGVLCLSYGAVSTLSLAPITNPVHDPRNCHSSHPQHHVRPSSVEKHLLSDSSHCPLESQHRLHVCTHCHKEVVSVVRCRQQPACTATGRRSAREIS